MKIFSPILKGTTTVSQGTTNLSGSFTGSLFGTAATASYADNFTVGGTLTAQTINVQIITSSIEFNTGSTRNGALSTNTHQFTGSVLMSGSVGIGTSSPGSPLTFYQSAFNKTTLGDARVIRLENSDPTVQLNSRQEIGFGYSTAYQPVVIGHQITNNTDFTNGSFYIAVRSGITNSAPTQVLTVTSAGNVGIGTSSPTDSIIGSGTFLDIASTGGGGLKLHYTNATAYGEFSFYKGSNGSYIDSAGAATLSNNDLIFRTGGTVSNYGVSERMRITSAGSLLINTTTSNSYPLELEAFTGGNQIYLKRDGANAKMFMGGSTGASTAFYIQSFNTNGVYLTAGGTSWTANSDIRLKNVISPIDSAVDKLTTLNPVIFSWKSDDTNKENIGLIAQDVKEVLPQVIDTNEDGFLGVRYVELIPVLVKAIQELKAENDTLKEILQRNNIQ